MSIKSLPLRNEEQFIAGVMEYTDKKTGEQVLMVTTSTQKGFQTKFFGLSFYENKDLLDLPFGSPIVLSTEISFDSSIKISKKEENS